MVDALRNVWVIRRAPQLRSDRPPSHGENRGSSPLGSASDFNNLTRILSWEFVASPTFLQLAVSKRPRSRHLPFSIGTGSHRLAIGMAAERLDGAQIVEYGRVDPNHGIARHAAERR